MPQVNPEHGGNWGIMGGIFDPIHLGHLILAEQARQAFELLGVLFVVGRVPPHRQNKPVAPFNDRVKMTSLAIDGNESFLVSDCEKEIEPPNYTIKTIEYLQAKYPTVNWYLILGEDNLAIFDSWHQPESIVEKVQVIVGNRPGYEQMVSDSPWRKNFQYFPMPLIEISSTWIRGTIREGGSIRYLVPEKVRRYIIEKDFYK